MSRNAQPPPLSRLGDLPRRHCATCADPSRGSVCTLRAPRPPTARRFDKDGDGQLSVHEFAAMMRSGQARAKAAATAQEQSHAAVHGAVQAAAQAAGAAGGAGEGLQGGGRVEPADGAAVGDPQAAALAEKAAAAGGGEGQLEYDDDDGGKDEYEALNAAAAAETSVRGARRWGASQAAQHDMAWRYFLPGGRTSRVSFALLGDVQGLTHCCGCARPTGLRGQGRAGGLEDAGQRWGARSRVRRPQAAGPGHRALALAQPCTRTGRRCHARRAAARGRGGRALGRGGGGRLPGADAGPGGVVRAQQHHHAHRGGLAHLRDHGCGQKLLAKTHELARGGCADSCDLSSDASTGINWMRVLGRLSVDYFIVGATDAKTAQVGLRPLYMLTCHEGVRTCCGSCIRRRPQAVYGGPQGGHGGTGH